MVYIVIDTKGAGRVVGVFEDPERAERIRAIDRGYFRVIAIEPNVVNTAAVEWLPTEEKRQRLRSA